MRILRGCIMRFQILTALLLCVLLGATLLATGCTTIPVASMVKLSRIDFETTDLSALRAAVLLPAYMQPLPGTARLLVTVERSGTPKIEESLALHEVDDPEAATLNVESTGDRRLYAFSLSAESARTLEKLRHEVRSEPRRDGEKRNLTLKVAAKACHTNAIPDGPVPITTYLKTTETKSFVPLTRNVDLRTLVSGQPLEIQPCPR
jgi:hypothetical protein